METPAPVLREEKAGRSFTCNNYRSSLCGRQGWLSWAKRHWGWSLYTEVNVLSHQDAYKLLFSGLCRMATLPCLYVLAMLCSPRLCKEGIFMPNLPSPERKTCWECLSSNGKSLNQTRPPQSRGSQLFICHNYRRRLGGKKNKYSFPEWRNIWAGVHSLIWLFSWTRKLPSSCLLCLWNGYFSLVLWTSYALISLILKRKILNATSGFSSKEIKFWKHFNGWKISALIKFSEIKRQHIGLSL